MPIEGLIGILVGLLGAGAGVAVVVGISAGWFSGLAVVRPAPGVAARPAAEVLGAMLAANDEAKPWQLRPCPEEPRADVVGEWRVVDQRWWGLMARSGLRFTYRAWFALDEGRHEVSCAEEQGRVSWGVEGPSLHWEQSFFQGMILFQRTREIVYGLNDAPVPEFGRVVDYDFDPWRVKAPVVRAALERGWSFRPVVFRGQLRRSALR